MIKNKKDLADYISQDLVDYKNRNLLSLWCRGSEGFIIVLFIKSLRHYEYYYNLRSKSIFNSIRKQFWRFIYRHCQLKFSLYIGVNVAGPGLRIMHPGFRRLMTVASVGSNCTILPMVLIGKSKPNSKDKVVIGNDCYISTGVTILAPVRIGNNVVIGAGAVVTKDIPDNAIVVGVPAKVIGMNEIN